MLAAGAVLGGPAFAQDYVASIVRQLRKQGFQTVVQERTLLGRIRIVATRGDGRREIIVNPGTGEILRDLWTPESGGSRDVVIIDDKGDDDDDDDDDDDRDDDDDKDDDNDSGHDGGGEGGSGDDD